jgi:hypothetical protein
MKDLKLPRVMQYNADFGGCGYWRLLWAQFLLNMKGKGLIYNAQYYTKDYLFYAGLDVVHIQRQGTPGHLQFFEKMHEVKERMKFRLIYEADDIIFAEDIPKWNRAGDYYHKPEIRESVQKLMEICDEMTVSTVYLRDYLLKKTSQKNISVIPNYPPFFWIGQYYSEENLIRSYRKNRGRPRILYAGGASHFSSDITGKEVDDFHHVREAIIKTADEFRWIFVGAFPASLMSLVRAGKIESLPWQMMDTYPEVLSSLGISMAIAPLADNVFNKAKSDLKYLEASALGIPIACQDMCTYATAPIRFRTGEEMIEQIRRTLSSEESFIEHSRAGRKAIQSRWLEKEENLGKYLDVYQFPYGDPRRQYLS